MSKSDAESEFKGAPKVDFEECPYSVLEVSIDADQAALKKAFQRMVIKYHPDNRQEEEKELGNKQMMVINAAYSMLKDGASRAKYDAKLSKRVNSEQKTRTTPRSKSTGSGTAPGGAWGRDSYSGQTSASGFGFRTGDDDISATEAEIRRQKEAWEYERMRERRRAEDRSESAKYYYKDDVPSTGSDGPWSAELEELVAKEAKLMMDLVRLKSRVDEEGESIDWGEVTDSRQIQDRMKDLCLVKDLEEAIGDIQMDITETKRAMTRTQGNSRALQGNPGDFSSSSIPEKDSVGFWDLPREDASPDPGEEWDISIEDLDRGQSVGQTWRDTTRKYKKRQPPRDADNADTQVRQGAQPKRPRTRRPAGRPGQVAVKERPKRPRPEPVKEEPRPRRDLWGDLFGGACTGASGSEAKKTPAAEPCAISSKGTKDVSSHQQVSPVGGVEEDYEDMEDDEGPFVDDIDWAASLVSEKTSQGNNKSSLDESDHDISAISREKDNCEPSGRTRERNVSEQDDNLSNISSSVTSPTVDRLKRNMKVVRPYDDMIRRALEDEMNRKVK
jgi:curved DNA-binding protein CbpA